MSTVIKGDITTMRNNLIREKEEYKKKREEERAILHNARTDSTLYNTKQWKRLRNWYIRQHPLCEIHLKHGISKPAQEVHHKQFITSGKTEEEQRLLCFDENNLMSLCTVCHHGLHNLADLRHTKYIDDYTPPECLEY